MEKHSKAPPRAGGIWIALGIMGGAIVGLLVGQPSIGLFGGLILGLLAAIVLAVRDRKNI